MADSERDELVVAWRYRHRKNEAWSFTEDREKIKRLRRDADDRDGTLTNERLPSWEVDPLVVAERDQARRALERIRRVALDADLYADADDMAADVLKIASGGTMGSTDERK